MTLTVRARGDIHRQPSGTEFAEGGCGKDRSAVTSGSLVLRIASYVTSDRRTQSNAPEAFERDELRDESRLALEGCGRHSLFNTEKHYFDEVMTGVSISCFEDKCYAVSGD